MTASRPTDPCSGHLEPAGRRRSRRRGWVPVFLLGLAVLGGLGLWGLSRLGRWLVLADPLEPAQAVVVLGGHMPVRAMEAASIYRERWAREVWLTRGPTEPEELMLRKLDIPVVREEFYNREVLGRLGVPADAIRLLDDPVRNTAEEVRRIAQELARVGGDRVILVTSKAHSRRVRATWRALLGDRPRAIVRYARDDPYEPEGWWRHTREALVVSREIFGLLNVWAGFVVQPDRP